MTIPFIPITTTITASSDVDSEDTLVYDNDDDSQATQIVDSVVVTGESMWESSSEDSLTIAVNPE